jgi:putative hydrolase of the HAD superfamily
MALLVFTLNDTLYNATLQKSQARLAAIEAMIENGLPVDVETAYTMLEEVVAQSGENAPNHFNLLMRRLGLKEDPRIIAAGVVAYREASSAALKPFPRVQPTLLTLREKGHTLLLLSAGDPVKEWQKLIQLGLQHLFHAFEICTTQEKINKEFISSVISNKSDTLFISGKEYEVLEAEATGLKAVLFSPKAIGRGFANVTSKRLVINQLSELLKMV